MNRSTEKDPLFRETVLIPSASVDVAAIRRRAIRKRLRRRVAIGGLASVSLLGLAMSFPSTTSNQTAGVDKPNLSVANSEPATAPSLPPSIPALPPSNLGEPSEFRAESVATTRFEPVTSDGTEAVVTSVDSSSVADLRLFANVTDKVPVFELEEKTQHFVHVGWMESEKTIPVDVNRLSRQQQAVIRDALYKEQVNAPLNL